MKKQTNISVLKELVNNNVMELVELYTSGVQAYNIAEGEEYNVIVAYAKQGGRYYFIDRDGRRFWLFRQGLFTDEDPPRWFIHGLFA